MEQTNHNFLSGEVRPGSLIACGAALPGRPEHLEQKTQDAITEEMLQRLEGMEWLLREVRER